MYDIEIVFWIIVRIVRMIFVVTAFAANPVIGWEKQSPICVIL